MIETTSSGSESGTDGPSDGVPAVDLCWLVAEHYQDVFRYAYRLSGSQADAEDLTQQAFLVAQAKLYQLREPEKAIRWLFAVLRSCFLKYIARQRPLSVDTLDSIVDDSEESETIDQEALQDALRDLPEENRLVVLMFYFEELTYREIADQLKIPMGTVMSRLARAKSRLRKRLNGEQGDRKSASGARSKLPAR